MCRVRRVEGGGVMGIEDFQRALVMGLEGCVLCLTNVDTCRHESRIHAPFLALSPGLMTFGML